MISICSNSKTFMPMENFVFYLQLKQVNLYVLNKLIQKNL